MSNIIINLHKVTDKSWFEMLIKYLSVNYNLVDINAIQKCYDSKTNGQNICHITIDDGDISFKSVIYPILKKYRVPATLFVSPFIAINNKNFWFQDIQNLDQNILHKCIADITHLPHSFITQFDIFPILSCLKISDIEKVLERYKRYNGNLESRFQNMSMQELLEVESEGIITIGAHTLKHPILSNESDEHCQYEIAESINLLSSALGHPVRYFAFPNGIPKLDYGEREINFLKQNKISLSFTTLPRHISFRESPLEIPRIGLSIGSLKFIQTKLLMGSYWDFFKKIIEPSEESKREKIYSKLKQ